MSIPEVEFRPDRGEAELAVDLLVDILLRMTKHDV